MQIKDYRQIIKLIIGSALFLILILSVLLVERGPRVRNVSFSKQPTESVQQTNSTVTINFDRAIENIDYSQYLRFEPTVDFVATTRGQSIELLLKQNLAHDTTYNLLLDPEVSDTSGRKMKSQFEHQFSTKAAEYMYLVRNYQELAEGDGLAIPPSNDPDDQIIHFDGEQENVVFGHPRIVRYAANSNYLVAVVEESDTQKLVSLDLNSGDTREESLLFGGTIEQLALSDLGDTAIYTITPIYDPNNVDFFESSSGTVQAVDLSDGNTYSLTDEEGDNLQAVSVFMDATGQVALLKKQDNTFIAVSPFNDYEPVNIGTFETSYGFNFGGTDIAFLLGQDPVIYNIARSEVFEIVPVSTGFVQDINIRSKELIMLYATVVSGSIEYEIYRQNIDDQTQSSLLWSNTDAFRDQIRDVTVSHDANQLAIVTNPRDCVFDDYFGNRQCSIPSMTLFDAKNDQELRQIEGFDLVWLP